MKNDGNDAGFNKALRSRAFPSGGDVLVGVGNEEDNGERVERRRVL